MASDVLSLGLSRPLETFMPKVTQLQMMQDDGSEPWLNASRHLLMACPGGMPEYSSNPSTASRSYISDRPRLLHQRFWRKVKQVTLDPGTSYSQEESITYGTSTSHEESRTFSQTLGVETQISGGWAGFSASVQVSFEQTETSSEVDAVTFSTQETKRETYTVQADAQRTRLYALWQLVDRFVLVDADTVRVKDSPTLQNVRIDDVVDIEFPNKDVIYQSVTRF